MACILIGIAVMAQAGVGLAAANFAAHSTAGPRRRASALYVHGVLLLVFLLLCLVGFIKGLIGTAHAAGYINDLSDEQLDTEVGCRVVVEPLLRVPCGEGGVPL